LPGTQVCNDETQRWIPTLELAVDVGLLLAILLSPLSSLALASFTSFYLVASQLISKKHPRKKKLIN
jgi:hypothetical protein